MNIITISPTVSGWATVVYEDGTAKKMRSTQLEMAKAAFALQTPAPAAEDGAESMRARKIGNRRADVSKYERVNGSMDCADPVAKALRGMPIQEVYIQAAISTGYPAEELIQKYGHLNLGMQRMCLGNLIRRSK